MAIETIDVAEAAADPQARWNDIATLIEDGLRDALATPVSGLSAAATRVALSGGKRIRARLVFASACAAAPSGEVRDAAERLVDAAVAIELLHAGSLVHDDVLDRATERRGVATVNAHEGTSWAILAGDMMLARAARLASQLGQAEALCFADLLDALCTGQADESASLHNWSRTRAEYLRATDGKTSSLIAGACRFGAMQVCSHGPTIEILDQFGRSFGLAFQILDDVADIVLDPDELGKPALQDVREGVASLPLIVAVEQDPAIVAMLEARPTSWTDLTAIRSAIRRTTAVTDSLAIATDLIATARSLFDDGGGLTGHGLPLLHLVDEYTSGTMRVLDAAR